MRPQNLLSIIKTLTTIAILALTYRAEAGNVRSVSGWNEAIPVSSKVILAQLRAEAAYLSYETDDYVCGGQILSPELVDSNEIQNQDGTKIYNLRVRFHVTKAINYCASEAQLVCEAPFQVANDNDIVMGDWACN